MIFASHILSWLHFLFLWFLFQSWHFKMPPSKPDMKKSSEHMSLGMPPQPSRLIKRNPMGSVEVITGTVYAEDIAVIILPVYPKATICHCLQISRIIQPVPIAMMSKAVHLAANRQKYTWPIVGFICGWCYLDDTIAGLFEFCYYTSRNPIKTPNPFPCCCLHSNIIKPLAFWPFIVPIAILYLLENFSHVYSCC